MTSFRYTVFRDVKARKAQRRSEDWPALVKRLAKPQEYRDKKAMPLLSLCRYGDRKSPAGSLRHAANVKSVHGVEIDYDGGKVTPEEARDRFRKAGVTALIYTSPSHKPDHPKWRALLPLSEPVAPDRRAEMVGKANRVLGGIAARESFTLSQSFYFGRKRKAEYLVLESKGRRCIDRHKARPLPAKGSKKDGKGGAFDEIPDDHFIEAFEKGTGRYNAALALSARWIGKGRDPEKVRKELHKYVRLAEHDGIKPVTTQGENLYTAINRLVDSAETKFGKQAKTREKDKATAPSSEFNWIDASSFLGAEPEPERFLIDGWLTMPNVGLYSAHGGSGKSYVALEIAVCVAVGASVFGRATTQGRVLYISAEDSRRRLHTRVSRICKALKIDKASLKGKLFISDATQADTILFKAGSRYSEAEITERYKALRREVKRLRPVFVVLDSGADHFGGNENDREQVRAFVRKLMKLTSIKGQECHVLLIAHVDAASINDGEDSKGFSGSTAWWNSVRNLLHQWRDKDSGDHILKLRKINYGAPGCTATIRWNDETLKFDLGPTRSGHDSANRYAFRVLRCIAALEEDGTMLYGLDVSKGSITTHVYDHASCPPTLKALGKSAVREVIKKLIDDKLLDTISKRNEQRKAKTVFVLTDAGRDRLKVEG